MNRKIAYLLIMIGVLITNACTPNSTNVAEKMPGIDIPLTEFNTKVVMLNFPDNPPAYKDGDLFIFLIKNRSADEIIFAQDYGSKVFKKQGTLWLPLENEMGYADGENFLPTNKADPTGLVFSAFPELSDLQSSAIIRIAIVGRVKNNPTEQVGAYIDVQYHPSARSEETRK
jgi:hypothetical protein